VGAGCCCFAVGSPALLCPLLLHAVSSLLGSCVPPLCHHVVTWLVAPTIHPASSGSQQWGWVLGGHSFVAWCSFMLACWHSGLSFVGIRVGWDSPLSFLHPRPILHCHHHSTRDLPHKQLLMRLRAGSALLSVVCCLLFIVHCL
jgi:hypothetical protein